MYAVLITTIDLHVDFQYFFHSLINDSFARFIPYLDLDPVTLIQPGPTYDHDVPSYQNEVPMLRALKFVAQTDTHTYRQKDAQTDRQYDPRKREAYVFKFE